MYRRDCGWGDADADALLLGDADADALLLGDALLYVGSGDALLVVVGDIVVVVWAAAGVVGCISASQFRRDVKPAATTNTATTTINRLLRILSTFYVKGFATR